MCCDLIEKQHHHLPSNLLKKTESYLSVQDVGNLLLLFQINSLYIHCPVSTVYLHNAQEGGPYSDMISLYIHSDQLLFLKNQLYADHWGESKTPVDATSF